MTIFNAGFSSILVKPLKDRQTLVRLVFKYQIFKPISHSKSMMRMRVGTQFYGVGRDALGVPEPIAGCWVCSI
jgi:hypothetical protein